MARARLRRGRASSAASSSTGSRAATPRDYAVEASDDGRRWRDRLRGREAATAGATTSYLPESESRWLRLRARARRRAAAPARSASVPVEPLDWSRDAERLLRARSRATRRAGATRATSPASSRYWTVVGVERRRPPRRCSARTARSSRVGGLLDRAVPARRAVGLVTWADVPAAAVARARATCRSRRWTWRRGTPDARRSPPSPPASAGAAVAAGPLPRGATRDRCAQRVTLFLALRPFQVNPPSQFLNTPGGAAPARRASAWWRARSLASTAIDRRGRRDAARPRSARRRSTQGDVVELPARGRAACRARKRPTRSGARVRRARLSACRWRPARRGTCCVEIPLDSAAPAPSPRRSTASAAAYGERRLAATVRDWSERLDRVDDPTASLRGRSRRARSRPTWRTS